MNRDRNSVPIDYLRECLDYCAETGVLRWKRRPPEHFACDRIWRTWNTRFAGTEANSPNRRGYFRVQIVCDGIANTLFCHRVAWALVTGSWPSKEIDHKNGNRSDNRLCNLREATAIENRRNQRLNKRNKLGVKGVILLPSGRYYARIKTADKQITIGTYDTLEQASAAYKAAAVREFGVFASA